MTSVLHVLDHSLPEQSGYASRSHAILCALAGLGVQVTAVTSPKHGSTEGREDEIDGIRYRRSMIPALRATDGILGQVNTVRYTSRAVRNLSRECDIGLLHAHSPCLNGLAVQTHRLPVVYEMRSSWEDAAVSNGTTEEGSLRYRVSRMLETYVARKADAVTVICEGLKRELLERGILERKITVVPNALPDSLFETAGSTEVRTLRDRFGLEGRRVIGFFGSFFDWEGVASLIRVLPYVTAKVPGARLLLAGGGRQEAALREQVAKLGVSDRVVFAGRLSRAEVRAGYAIADLMVFPRQAIRLTDMVTPLKPLEAMAQRVPVLASDVGGHRELVSDGETGFLYPACDIDELARRIAELLQPDGPALRVVDAAYRFVDRERRWSVVAERYLPIYDRLLRTSGRAIDAPIAGGGD